MIHGIYDTVPDFPSDKLASDDLSYKSSKKINSRETIDCLQTYNVVSRGFSDDR